MASVTLKNLWKKYGEVEAVCGICLDIADGELMAFLGPSGCGKSSTLRVIAGLEEITSGEIYFDGKLINRVRPRDRNVAMAFETYALYPTLNVYENLAFPLRAKRRPESEIDEQVHHIAGILEIEDIMDRMPNQLSGGQQQRVGLARALVRKPDVFLLDEPISHLDTRQRSRMRAYLKRLHLELGYTMIYVTHDQEEAMALADRVAIMCEGVFFQVGTPDEIFHRPVNEFVADFVGEPPMNFLDCEFVREEGQACLKGEGFKVAAPQEIQVGADRGELPRELRLGIRPIHIRVSLEQNERYTIPARVFVLEPLGDMAILTAEMDERRVLIVTPPDFRSDPGDTVWLHFDEERVHVFDPRSGVAIARDQPL